MHAICMMLEFNVPVGKITNYTFLFSDSPFYCNLYQHLNNIQTAPLNSTMLSLQVILGGLHNTHAHTFLHNINFFFFCASLNI